MHKLNCYILSAQEIKSLHDPKWSCLPIIEYTSFLLATNHKFPVMLNRSMITNLKSNKQKINEGRPLLKKFNADCVNVSNKTKTKDAYKY